MKNRTAMQGVCVLFAMHFVCAGNAIEQMQIKQIAFKQLEVHVGSATHQTILTGNFLDGEMDNIAVVQNDGDDAFQLDVFVFRDAEWHPEYKATLPSKTLFVDVVNINERDRLVVYEPGRFSFFDLESGVAHSLADIAFAYSAERNYAGAELRNPYDEGEVPHIDVTRDLNGDERDDLIVPDVDGFWVSTQSSEGTFAVPLKLGPQEPFRDAVAFDDKRTYGEAGISPLTIPWYMSRVHQLDYDRDGRGDLVFWNEDHFDVYLQNADGSFETSAPEFKTDVPFDSDGAYSLMFGFKSGNPAAMLFGVGEKTEQTVLRAVRDLNGDGTADILTHTLSGRSVLKQRSRYQAYFGTTTGNGIEFDAEPDTAIVAKGKAGALEFSGYSSQWLDDFNGDGQLDLLRGDVKLSIASMCRALVGRSISIGAELYCMDEGGYAESPTMRRKVTAAFDPMGDRNEAFFPFVLVGDVNGDRAADVLVGKRRDTMLVFPGGPDIEDAKPRKIAVTLPGDERNTRLVDMNRDGKDDVLMHHPSGEDSSRVTVLIAQ